MENWELQNLNDIGPLIASFAQNDGDCRVHQSIASEKGADEDNDLYDTCRTVVEVNLNDLTYVPKLRRTERETARSPPQRYGYDGTHVSILSDTFAQRNGPHYDAEEKNVR